MHEFIDEDINWLFIEFYEVEDALLETNYNFVG
jgi:hypothetical protein